MLEKILDLHIHSKYARACSPRLELPAIAEACALKGIDIVSTGDFTHPAWFKHLEENLVEDNEGVYKLKVNKEKPTALSGFQTASPIRFIVGTEISCIYRDKDKTRRVHLLVFFPSLQAAGEFNRRLEERGANIRADGRPIIGMSSKALLQLVLDIDPTGMVIPAHAWTPWFAVFGSKSGYDSLEECFEELTPQIFAIETGLSSDPPMNHRLSGLDGLTLVSNSDAHSLGNLGREANVFAFKNESVITYQEIRRIIKEGHKKEFLYTIEFYPEEGMYHYDGHRECQVVLTPTETKKAKSICPVCKKLLTVGVLNRVEALADRSEKNTPDIFIPHRYIVPLREIIATSLEVGVNSKKVALEYNYLLKKLGSEFEILLHLDLALIANTTHFPAVALGLANMRAGQLTIAPGYDGVYGTVDLFSVKKSGAPNQAALL